MGFGRNNHGQQGGKQRADVSACQNQKISLPERDIVAASPHVKLDGAAPSVRAQQQQDNKGVQKGKRQVQSGGNQKSGLHFGKNGFVSSQSAGKENGVCF